MIHNRFAASVAMACLLLAAAASDANVSLNQKSLSVDIGAAEKLVVAPAGQTTLWKTADPKIAQVFGNGWVVGVKAGSTAVSATIGGASAECPVTVEATDNKLRDPSTIKQVPGNDKFEVNGRICYGTELNGKAVEREDRKFTESNRIINPKPLAPKEELEWEVQEGTEIFDGAGVLMGTVAPTVNVGDRRVPTSKFNYGMSKVIHGRVCAYAFAVKVKPDEKIRPLLDEESKNDQSVGTSAWLPIDRVVDQENLLDRLNIGHGKLPRLPLERTKYRITGGDPKMYMTEYGELSIVKDVDSGPVPSHYLRRPTGTINILYSVPGYGLGGQGLDSILINGDAIFRPARGAKRLSQPTYYPIRHPRKEKVSPKTMTFIYGAVEVEGSETIYGWVALEALTPTK